MEIKHRWSQNAKLQWFDAEMLIAVSRKELAVPLSVFRVHVASIRAQLQNKHWMLFLIFCFCFSIKEKILFGFLLVSENCHYCRSFIKVKKKTLSFEKGGYLYLCNYLIIVCLILDHKLICVRVCSCFLFVLKSYLMVKTERFPPRWVPHKIRMSTPATSIQHCTGSTVQIN